MDENTRFSNFMKTKFHKIPKYIRIKILKKVKFEPEIYFEKNSCLEIESNDIELYYINGKTKYNKIIKKWEYLCDPRNQRLNCLYISDDLIKFKPYFEVNCTEPGCQNILDGRTRKNICKDCGNLLCNLCYEKSIKSQYEYRKLCNTCIWFNLG